MAIIKLHLIYEQTFFIAIFGQYQYMYGPNLTFDVCYSTFQNKTRAAESQVGPKGYCGKLVTGPYSCSWAIKGRVISLCGLLQMEVCYVLYFIHSKLFMWPLILPKCNFVSFEPPNIIIKLSKVILMCFRMKYKNNASIFFFLSPHLK